MPNEKKEGVYFKGEKPTKPKETKEKEPKTKK